MELERAGLDGNNGKSAERTAVKSTNRSRNNSDLPLRLPHNPKVVSSNLAPATIYDYAVSFVAGGVVRFYFLHKRHISIPFGPISRGTDANEVFVYVHTKNIFAQRLLGAVRVFL